jgi:hypothetical protein
MGNFPTSPSYANSAQNSQLQQSSAAQYDAMAQTIVITARKYLGSRYALYGDTPSEGFSCIGFVTFVYRQLGISIPSGIDAAWNSGLHVAQSDLMPGDILFFSNTVFPGLSHVEIYIGNGQMIGADNFAVGVTIDNLDAPYWSTRYTGATRPLATQGVVTNSTAAAMVSYSPPSSARVSPIPLPVGSTIRPASSQVSAYSGPGYQYRPLSTLNPATSLAIVKAEGGWYEVRVGAAYGWVSVTSVRTVHVALNQHLTARVTDLGLNVRATASAWDVSLHFARAATQVGTGTAAWGKVTRRGATLGRTAPARPAAR